MSCASYRCLTDELSRFESMTWLRIDASMLNTNNESLAKILPPRLQFLEVYRMPEFNGRLTKRLLDLLPPKVDAIKALPSLRRLLLWFCPLMMDPSVFIIGGRLLLRWASSPVIVWKEFMPYHTVNFDSLETFRDMGKSWQADAAGNDSTRDGKCDGALDEFHSKLTRTHPLMKFDAEEDWYKYLKTISF